jgi:hypothetical protein
MAELRRMEEGVPTAELAGDGIPPKQPTDLSWWCKTLNTIAKTLPTSDNRPPNEWPTTAPRVPSNVRRRILKCSWPRKFRLRIIRREEHGWSDAFCTGCSEEFREGPRENEFNLA